MPSADNGRGGTARNRGMPGIIVEGTLKKSFWNVYDHIGLLILLNILFLLGSILIVTIPFATFFLLDVAMMLSDYREPSISVSLRTALGRYFPALLLILFYAFVVLFFSFNVYFYLSLSGNLALPGVLLAGIMLWAMLLCLATAIFAFPLLIRGGIGWRVLLKRSFLLLFDNMVPVGLVAFLIVVVEAVLLISGVGFLLLGVSIPAVMEATLFREVLKKYEERDEDDSWEERRGFRDLFRPWDNS